MKRSVKIISAGILAVGIFAFGVFANAKEEKEKQLGKKEVPAAVLAAFEKAYPKAVAKGYSWEEKDGKALYEIESLEGKIHRDVSFLENGRVFEKEEVVAVNSLPEAVREAVKKDHPKGMFLRAEKISRGTTVEYEVVIAQGKKKTEVKLDAGGKILETE